MLPIANILEKIKPREEEKEPFLALVIGERKVRSGIWIYKNGKGEILSIGSFENWGGTSAEELIVAADASIATAVAGLSEMTDRQPTKVVLGLPEDWLEGNNVKDEKIKILQTVCRKLLLTPQGFVVTSEEIAHYLKKEEGDLVSVILINLQETEMIVSLIVRGEYLGSKKVGRSNSLVSDLEEGLLRFEFGEVLPPRILLIDQGNFNETRQALISYPWVEPEKQKKLAFLQLPRVDLAKDDLEIASLVYTGSREIKKEEKINTTTIEEEPIAIENGQENFDFVQNLDIALQEPKEEKSPEIIPEIPRPVIKRKLPSFKLNFNFLAFFRPRFFIKGLLSLIIGFLVVIAGAGLIYFKIVKAQLVLLIKPAKVEKEIEFTKTSLPNLETISEISGEKTADVKGRKTVGEKAIGEIVVYNGSDKTKVFTPRTIIKGPDGLKFVLTQEVSAPAKTVDINASPPVEKWGEIKTKAEAVDIGTQYNIAAGSDLKLESLPASGSSILIRNVSAFSGGTSREISAVSKEDREALQKSLLAELQNRAEAEIKDKISTGFLLPGSFELKSKTDQFNHEINDETDQFSLEEKAVFSAIYFKEEDLRVLIDKEFESLVPEGFEKNFIKETKEIVVLDKKKNLYKVKAIREYYPKIDNQEIARQLAAKPLSKTKSLMENQKFIEGYEVILTPRIFSYLKFFPLNGKNITITFKSF